LILPPAAKGLSVKISEKSAAYTKGLVMTLIQIRRIAAAVLVIWALAGITGCKSPAPVAEPNVQELIVQQMEEQKALAVSLYVDAMMLNDLSQHQEAMKKLDLAIELDPAFTLAYSMKGDIYQVQKEYSDSATAYEKATQLDPWSFKDFFNLGKVCQVMREFARAVKAYVNACNLDPNHYEAQYGAAQCYYELKDYAPSLEHAQKAKTLNASSGDVEFLIGDIQEAQKNHLEAIDSYRRAMEIKGNDPNIMVPLAAVYLRTGRYSAARELLTEVIRIDPSQGLAHQYMGFVRLKFKETDLAVESYETAVTINDKDWMAHKGLGVAYMLLSMKNNNEKLKIQALEQWNISMQLKADQPELKKIMSKYND
jgi:tetratricopeptide (TPR) repeat protein